MSRRLAKPLPWHSHERAQELVVKLHKARVDALITAGEGEGFDPGHGRPMKEWLAVEPTSKEGWLDLAREAMGFVASQP